MKVLTIRQPWASAILGGGKDVENRTWRTSYRGPLAIHAASRLDDGVLHRDTRTEARAYWSSAGFDVDTLTLGAIVGVVDVIGCVPAQECDSDWANCWEGGPSFCWLLDDPRALVEPIPAKGRLGLWEWPELDAILAEPGAIIRL